jgi:hypothetical protein
MALAEFEPAIPATEQPNTYALDRAATRLGFKGLITVQFRRHGRCKHVRSWFGRVQ